jgi:aryl-alcohol dehydrogenase-like predicted oxidoreductase
VRSRRLGASGLKVSEVGLGTTAFGARVDGDEAVRVIQHAIALGITFIDTAVTYNEGRSEELIGKAIAGRRHEVVLATKAGLGKGYLTDRDLSRRHLMREIERSLSRLGTDHVDLFMAHRPDPNTPLDETIEAMDRMVRDGKVRYVGGSNYAAWQMAQAIGISEGRGLARWIAAENEWNLIAGPSDPQLLPASRALGFGIIPYMPLASGALTGKYVVGRELYGEREAELRRRGWITDASILAVERLKPWAAERGHTTAELAVAWLLAHDECATVIVGARSIDQLEENVRGAQWRMSEAERDEARAIALGHLAPPVAGAASGGLRSPAASPNSPRN